MQTTIPMLTYEDAGAMADWLCEAFGFQESGERFHDEEGRVNRAELSYGDGEVMLGYARPHYRGPRRHAEECEQAQRWLDNPYAVDGVLVHIEDLDAHLARPGGPSVDVRPAFLKVPRKERTIPLAALLNGSLHSTTFPDAPSTARE